MTHNRRQFVAGIAGATSALLARHVVAQVPAETGACPSPALVDIATAPLLALLPEAMQRAGLSPADAQAWDDLSPDGDHAVALAATAALPRLPAECGGDAGAARLLLDRWKASREAGYGRNDPLAAIHRPYRVSPYAGPHIDVPEALALSQPLDTADAVERWLGRLDRFADALLATGQGLRADAAAGCVPTVQLGRAVLAQMDDLVLTPAADQPLLAVLRARIVDPATAEIAAGRAAAIVQRRVQPAMASLRDTVAVSTRKARSEPGLWSLPHGEALYAANFVRAGDTDRTPSDAQAFAREEAKRVGALLDRRLAARGFKSGTIAERIAAAFTSHPGLIAGDDETGRAALAQAAASRIESAHAMLGKLVPPALATTSPPRVAGLPPLGKAVRNGSLYLPAGAGRDAVLWLDDRSSYALPVPGVSPIAYHLGLPGQHLLFEAGRTETRAKIVRAARWPALTEAWGCYAERLAAEAGLFARDPWGDIARLSDELLRAARLVVDVGLHAQRWTQVQAEQAMIELTGDAQRGAIDRIIAMPGEAASYTLGLDRLLALRTAAAKAGGRHFDPRGFHAAVLRGGPRPFALVTA